MYLHVCAYSRTRVCMRVCFKYIYVAVLRCFEFPGSIHRTLMSSVWDELYPVQLQLCSILIKLMACLQCNHFLLMCVCDTASVQSSPVIDTRPVNTVPSCQHTSGMARIMAKYRHLNLHKVCVSKGGCQFMSVPE